MLSNATHQQDFLFQIPVCNNFLSSLNSTKAYMHEQRKTKSRAQLCRLLWEGGGYANVPWHWHARALGLLYTILGRDQNVP